MQSFRMAFTAWQAMSRTSFEVVVQSALGDIERLRLACASDARLSSVAVLVFETKFERWALRDGIQPRGDEIVEDLG